MKNTKENLMKRRETRSKNQHEFFITVTKTEKWKRSVFHSLKANQDQNKPKSQKLINKGIPLQDYSKLQYRTPAIKQRKNRKNTKSTQKQRGRARAKNYTSMLENKGISVNLCHNQNLNYSEGHRAKSREIKLEKSQKMKKILSHVNSNNNNHKLVQHHDLRKKYLSSTKKYHVFRSKSIPSRIKKVTASWERSNKFSDKKMQSVINEPLEIIEVIRKEAKEAGGFKEALFKKLTKNLEMANKSSLRISRPLYPSHKDLFLSKPRKKGKSKVKLNSKVPKTENEKIREQVLQLLRKKKKGKANDSSLVGYNNRVGDAYGGLNTNQLDLRLNEIPQRFQFEYILKKNYCGRLPQSMEIIPNRKDRYIGKSLQIDQKTKSLRPRHNEENEETGKLEENCLENGDEQDQGSEVYQTKNYSTEEDFNPSQFVQNLLSKPVYSNKSFAKGKTRPFFVKKSNPKKNKKKYNKGYLESWRRRESIFSTSF